ncbi:hypothetical protein [Noviherbaspirillum galbum]|uniref:Uncharacterized protein n=1 Tax=Noviherbaspirillum galbum TaxID=2709383 RepID=A0A6B3SXD6_9BURK|nr:hypothetical protein [Noviherbaspirillum galbum]NEX64205.1 hypothetical protein [Noviherbaspirillum galbum]
MNREQVIKLVDALKDLKVGIEYLIPSDTRERDEAEAQFMRKLPGEDCRYGDLWQELWTRCRDGDSVRAEAALVKLEVMAERDGGLKLHQGLLGIPLAICARSLQQGFKGASMAQLAGHWIILRRVCGLFNDIHDAPYREQAHDWPALPPPARSSIFRSAALHEGTKDLLRSLMSDRFMPGYVHLRYLDEPAPAHGPGDAIHIPSRTRTPSELSLDSMPSLSLPFQDRCSYSHLPSSGSDEAASSRRSSFSHVGPDAGARQPVADRAVPAEQSESVGLCETLVHPRVGRAAAKPNAAIRKRGEIRVHCKNPERLEHMRRIAGRCKPAVLPDAAGTVSAASFEAEKPALDLRVFDLGDISFPSPLVSPSLLDRCPSLSSMSSPSVALQRDRVNSLDHEEPMVSGDESDARYATMSGKRSVSRQSLGIDFDYPSRTSGHAGWEGFVKQDDSRLGSELDRIEKTAREESAREKERVTPTSWELELAALRKKYSLDGDE